ncbi:hypothetical protein K502DRAFT_349335 [Neoconidiobolus thromboides FSU 785]|nr:hypothetical protein K502DRAFT_349335 [Neoconidiobolus thromboides FSU 785]
MLSYIDAESLAINDKQPLEYVCMLRDISSQSIIYGPFAPIIIPLIREILTFIIRPNDEEKWIIVFYIATLDVPLPFNSSESFCRNDYVVPVPIYKQSKNDNQPQLLEVSEVRKITIDIRTKTPSSRSNDPLLTLAVNGTYIENFILPYNISALHIFVFLTSEKPK